MNDQQISSLSELSRLKKRVAELEEQETRIKTENVHLRQLYEQAPLAYQSLDSDGCFIEINNAWLETLDYSREEVNGKNFSKFYIPTGKDILKIIFLSSKRLVRSSGLNLKWSKKMAKPSLLRFTVRSAKTGKVVGQMNPKT